MESHLDTRGSMQAGTRFIAAILGPWREPLRNIPARSQSVDARGVFSEGGHGAGAPSQSHALWNRYTFLMLYN